MFLRQLNLDVLSVYSDFALITKKKLCFSLICSFHSCLVKEGQALKVTKQFAIRGLVAYRKRREFKVGWLVCSI